MTIKSFQLMSILVFLSYPSLMVFSSSEALTSIDGDCIPHSPKVHCSFLPLEFLQCDKLEDLSKYNNSDKNSDTKKLGCSKYGGQRYDEVVRTQALCKVLDGIECCGPREFYRNGFPCVKYSGYYFTTTLIYSLLLGFLGLDRFCLGHTGTAVGKLLTLGGVGIWWIVDIILLITGSLTPYDGSNWNTNV